MLRCVCLIISNVYMYNDCQRLYNIFFIDLACATSVHYNKLIYLLTRACRWSGRVTMTTELVYIHVSLRVHNH